MRHYEIVALVHPDQSAQIEDIVARYRKIVEDSGGQIHRYENWGRRKLAYPIRKIYKADYFLLNIECEPAVKDEIENAFRYYDSIIRSLIIRKDEAVTEQSPILKKLIKQEAEERAEKEREAAELARIREAEKEKAAAAAAEQEASEAKAGESDADTGDDSPQPDESDTVEATAEVETETEAAAETESESETAATATEAATETESEDAQQAPDNDDDGSKEPEKSDDKEEVTK